MNVFQMAFHIDLQATWHKPTVWLQPLGVRPETNGPSEICRPSGERACKNIEYTKWNKLHHQVSRHQDYDEQC